MKKIIFACAIILMAVSSACTEKSEQASIVGEWERTFEDSSSAVVRYDFRDDNHLISKMITDDDSITENGLWYLMSDTLVLYKEREPEEEPGQPVVMIVEKLTQTEMFWRYLRVGGPIIKLRRL